MERCSVWQQKPFTFDAFITPYEQGWCNNFEEWVNGTTRRSELLHARSPVWPWYAYIRQHKWNYQGQIDYISRKRENTNRQGIIVRADMCFSSAIPEDLPVSSDMPIFHSKKQITLDRSGIVQERQEKTNRQGVNLNAPDNCEDLLFFTIFQFYKKLDLQYSQSFHKIIRLCGQKRRMHWRPGSPGNFFMSLQGLICPVGAVGGRRAFGQQHGPHKAYLQIHPVRNENYFFEIFSLIKG